ncbi:ABC transporter permease [Sphaerisporangium siamense]|uniref:Peptide/nickel transport system permease protein n=1 Tax=Sphaerisporangium siamense TaxID=795645 RepID=A0A7W7G8E9_9ACTN|nr:ABC transporter permease [Sphaerisporangium siamense]MBB4699430.1 peptide/nickel transport system permease protein [Sphaerisporangium siamense]
MSTVSEVVDAVDLSPSTPDAPAPQRNRSGALRILRSGQVRLGCALVLLTMAFALIGPLLAPHDPGKSIALPYAGPGDGLPLGADQLGRDVLSRVLAGGFHLAWMAPAAAIAAVALGALVGIAAAFYGGMTDIILMRIMDVLLAFPALLFTLLFVSVIGPKPWLLVVLTAIGMTPGVARVIRGAARPLNDREYVMWSRTVGIPSRTILLRCFLPNVSSPLLVELGMRLMWSIGILAAISFLGYGIQPPAADWGLMISENRTGLANMPWAVLAPVACIVLFTIGGNLIAEGAARVIARTEGGRD